MTAPPFKYVAGDPALDLVNTADWTAAGPRAERLPDYGRFVGWAEGAGLVPADGAARLRRAARRHPGAAADTLAAVHRAREVLQRVFTHRASGDRPAPRDLAALNRLLSDALGHLELAPGAWGVVLGWRDIGTELEGPLWPVMWSAARLLASNDAGRIRVCGGTDCGWMYVDRSRNGLRRWCEMETCGTREKNRRRASAR
ncbi:MAG: CGNR zinc finger domain-containing protein [Gemmatimonadales bacterium]